MVNQISNSNRIQSVRHTLIFPSSIYHHQSSRNRIFHFPHISTPSLLVVVVVSTSPRSRLGDELGLGNSMFIVNKQILIRIWHILRHYSFAFTNNEGIMIPFLLSSFVFHHQDSNFNRFDAEFFWI